uniref:Uncharacterized protein n=1 Tax=Oryza meridionalis TaxID=40149 RepID=A0A0E0EF42_9ORYZ
MAHPRVATAIQSSHPLARREKRGERERERGKPAPKSLSPPRFAPHFPRRISLAAVGAAAAPRDPGERAPFEPAAGGFAFWKLLVVNY